jgi:Autoinducer binding domain
VHQDDFFDLIDRLAVADKIEAASDLLTPFLNAWGVHNVAYAALNMPTPGSSRPLLSVTYSADWQKHYAQSGYVDIDPIVRSGLGGILPVDWSEIDRSDPVVRKFFGEAQELDVGANGLSIPIRGRLGEFALFCITSNESDAEWRAVKGELLRDLMILAFNFHAAALRACGSSPSEAAVHLPCGRPVACAGRRSARPMKRLAAFSASARTPSASISNRRAPASIRRIRPIPSPALCRSA